MNSALALTLMLTFLIPASASGDIEGCWEPIVHVSAPAGTAVISPGRTAPPLSDQGITVTVEVLDCNSLPVQNFPAQDIWLDDIGNGEITLCQNGAIADHNTDASGITSITGALAGGGSTTEGTSVFISGIAVDGVLPLQLISPDYDGDLQVGIVDFGFFGLDFGQSGAARSDFSQDGLVDINDFAFFGVRFGEQCP